MSFNGSGRDRVGAGLTPSAFAELSRYLTLRSYLPKNGGLFTVHHGGSGARTQMICGFLGLGSTDHNPVIATLPPLFTFNVAHGGAADWIRSTLQYGAAEVAAGRPGSETMLAKLSELLFLEAVRRYAEALPDDQTGWLAGLREPYVGRALALLHRDIARPWTVEDLGREVGLSRSALADRFISFIGVPPMHYLTNWRMQVAGQKLRRTSASLAQVAEAIGYESEAAFSRAFKKTFGANGAADPLADRSGTRTPRRSPLPAIAPSLRKSRRSSLVIALMVSSPVLVDTTMSGVRLQVSPGESTAGHWGQSQKSSFPRACGEMMISDSDPNSVLAGSSVSFHRSSRSPTCRTKSLQPPPQSHPKGCSHTGRVIDASPGA